jgi:AraC-like DNA-binding protein
VRSVSGSERLAYLRGARDLMDRHDADPLDLDQMAAHCEFSKFHFARAFKAAYGESPASYSPAAGLSGPRTCCARPTWR